MERSERITKQITALAALLIIVGGISFFAYLFIKSNQPVVTATPTPILSNIEVVRQYLINAGGNDHDLLVQVRNPNQSHGASLANYEARFFNSSEQLISTVAGSFYILPGQIKYLVHSPLSFTDPVARVEFNVKSVKWGKLEQLPISGVNLVLVRSDYSEPKEQGVFAKASGIVLNDSDFDLDGVDVVVVALNSNEMPIAVNRTSINTFLSKTSRGFEVRWANPMPEAAVSMTIGIYTNILENSNFLRRFGEPERFQEFY